jgi:threonyl-tRNA synthetase
VGDASDWETATAALHHALERHAIPHELDEGGGAFYGPKIDLKVRDALGKEWQLSTVQFDFNLPERFELHYIGEDGRQHRPHMVHRALFGSVERFLGLLIEHYGGAFPLWLAPVQARVIPVSSNRHASYALSVARELQTRDFRVEVDDGKERMQAKVREAQVQKVPYMLIVGDREAAGGTVAVRLRSGEDLGDMPVSALIDRLQQEVDSHD